MLVSAPISPEEQDKLENKLKQTNLQWIKVRHYLSLPSHVLNVASVCFVLWVFYCWSWGRGTGMWICVFFNPTI